MAVEVDQDRIPSSCEKFSLHMLSDRLSCGFGSTSRGCMGRLLRHIIIILHIKRMLVPFRVFTATHDLYVNSSYLGP
jgi:hypothetical protein